MQQVMYYENELYSTYTFPEFCSFNNKYNSACSTPNHILNKIKGILNSVLKCASVWCLSDILNSVLEKVKVTHLMDDLLQLFVLSRQLAGFFHRYCCG